MRKERSIASKLKKLEGGDWLYISVHRIWTSNTRKQAHMVFGRLIVYDRDKPTGKRKVIEIGG